MRLQRCKQISRLLFITMPLMAGAQTLDKNQMKYERATNELETVLADAGKLERPLSVKVKAKAASLLWTQSPDRARLLFMSLWDFIDSQKDDKAFDQKESRTVLLRYLYPKDRRLADQLLQKLSSKTTTDNSNQLSFESIRGTDEESNQLARLAWHLLDADATLAAGVLERSVSRNTAPQTVLVLNKLRGNDPLLANYVARAALEKFRSQPKTVAVVGLTYLTGYLFPLTPAPAGSPEIEQSDEGLRLQFMSSGYELLKESLSESDEFLSQTQQLNAKSLQFRTFSQGFLAATLAALAMQYAPYLVPELNSLSAKLLSGLPEPLVQGANLQAAVIRNAAEIADDTGANIIPAIAGGEFDKAQGLIDKLKDENSKKSYAQLLLKAQFKSYVMKTDLSKALKLAQSTEEPAARMQMFTELAKVAHAKGAAAVSSEILSEARKTDVNPELKGRHARALFSFAAETAYFSAPDALLLLEDAVKELNGLGSQNTDGGDKASSAKVSILNDPNRFVDSVELTKAFSAVGRHYFEETLLVSEKLHNKAVQAMARLATIERTLKRVPPKAVPKPSTSSPKPKTN